MSILDNARADAAKIMGDSNGFAVAIALTTPSGSQTVSINGIHTKIHMAVSPDGASIVNSKTAHISFSESAAGTFPLRNAAGEVDIKNYKVDVKDSTGVIKLYVVMEAFADEMLGVIVCKLEDRESGS